MSHTFSEAYQTHELCLRVVRRDATTAMPKQVPTILELHARRAQPPPEGVLQIMYANVSKSRRRRFGVLMRPGIGRALASCLPRGVIHLCYRPRLALLFVRSNEYIDRVQPARTLHNRLRDPVEHDETFLAIFDVLAWNDKDGRIEFRHFHFIVLLQSANFFFPQARIHFEKRHAREVIGQTQVDDT